jgi:hypothetical protein
MATSTHLPLCVYCGTARPADQSRCPKCGRPWIDVHIGVKEQARVPAMAAVTVDSSATAEIPASPPSQPAEVLSAARADPEPEPAPDDPTATFRWLIPALIAAAAVVVIALLAFGVLDGSSEPVAQETTIPETPTSAAPATTTTTPAAPTTAAPAPTTTSTTTTTIPDPAALPSIGEAIAASELKLRAGGIGPIDVGAPADEAIGRLVASLGQPDETGAAGAELGVCPDEVGRFARWAGFTAIVSGRFDDGVFVGYRFAEQAIPTYHLDLATPSGIRLGDTVADLNTTYAAYQIDYVTTDGTTVFRLSDADGLLLWGPVSSTEDSGRIEGIFSPDSCAS